MSISRLLLVGCVVAAAIAAAASSACSSFSASDDPASGGDGGSGETSNDGGAGGEGGAGDAATCDATILAVLATDPQNCGKCGHSCLGGACLAGVCQPVLVGTTTGEAVFDVATDGTHVLWLTAATFISGNGHVYACPRAGCTGSGPLSLTGAPVSVGNLAGDGDKAFFSEPYGPPKVLAVTPSGAIQQIGSHIASLRLQMRSGLLFYTTLFEGSGGRYAGTVYRWDGTTETQVSHWDTAHNFQDMVVVGSRAFFSAPEFLTSCTLGVGQSCTDPTDFVMTSGEYQSLATDGTSVIWTDGSSVLSCSTTDPTCTGMTALLGPANLGGPVSVRDVVFDHGTLLLATSANDIFGCTLPDCAATLTKLVHEKRLFTGTEFVIGHALAADDAAIYWAAVDGTEMPDGDGGLDAGSLTHRVMKLAR